MFEEEMMMKMVDFLGEHGEFVDKTMNSQSEWGKIKKFFYYYYY